MTFRGRVGYTKVIVVAAVWCYSGSARADDLRVLLSARLCMRQRILSVVLVNNKALKRVGEELEPIEEYRADVEAARTALKDANKTALPCSKLVLAVARCLPESNEGYVVGDPENPRCQKPSMRRYLDAATH